MDDVPLMYTFEISMEVANKGWFVDIYCVLLVVVAHYN